MDRRTVLCALPALVAAPTAPAMAEILPPEADDRAKVIEVIEKLEDWRGWETSAVVAAKAFAAWQIRKALGLDLPNSWAAQMHIDYQADAHRRYTGTIHFERDLEAGKNVDQPTWELSLGEAV